MKLRDLKRIISKIPKGFDNYDVMLNDYDEKYYDIDSVDISYNEDEEEIDNVILLRYKS